MISQSTTEYLKDRFCDQPFEYMDVSRAPENEVHLCCPAWLPVSGGRVGKSDPFDIWNSRKFQEIRSSIHDGTFKYCNKDRCPKIQARTLPSKNEIQDESLLKIIKNRTVVLDRGPRKINLASDQTCNLSCPSCRTQKIVNTSGPLYENVVRSKDLLLNSFLSGLTKLYLTGSGDPFASRAYRDFLTSLDGSDYPNLKIGIVTNGQLLTEEMWNRLEKVHGNIDHIAISFDAASPETYRKVRRGGELENLIKNVRFLKQIKKSFLMRFDFVVQTMNYTEIPSFVELGKELGADEILFQKIVSWKTYSPSEFKRHAIYLEDHPQYRSFLEILQNPILEDPVVNLGNISEYRRISLARAI